MDFRFQLLPEPADAAGSRNIRDAVQKLGDGVHEVARDDDTSLWAKIVNGKTVDFRAFNLTDDREIGVVIFIEPSEALGPPTSEELRPPRTSDDDTERNDLAMMMADGGAYVCTANGDGGYTCWKQ